MNDDTLPNEAVLAQGPDHRLPSGAKTPKDLNALAHRSTVTLQRAATRLMRRMGQLKLFGENAEKEIHWKDQVGVQLLFELRGTIQALDQIDGLDPHQQLIALKTRLTGLLAMQQTNQSIMAEVARISANTNKTLIDLARVSKMEDRSDDDLTDAELAE